MSVLKFDIEVDKKSINTIISNVYKGLLKIHFDEMIDNGVITVNQLKYDSDVRNDLYLQFYHLSSIEILKSFFNGVDDKPIIYYEDLEVIESINNKIKSIIDNQFWVEIMEFCEVVFDEIWLGKSFNRITKELNNEGRKFPLGNRISSKLLKTIWDIHCDSSDFKLDFIKHFYKTKSLKIIQKSKGKLKWGGELFYHYYKPNDSYIIEFLGDGKGILYDSIHHYKQNHNTDIDFIELNKECMNQLYHKIEKNRLKLFNRINSYCGWKIKQMSFRKYREKYGEDGIIMRIIRYMIVKEYDLNRWCWKTYGDLLHRDLIGLVELLEFKNQFFLHSYDFKLKIKNQLIEVLSKYDYRDKPKVIKVDINKYFRIRNKYNQYLNI